MTLIDTRKTLILPIILIGLMISATAANWTAQLKLTGNITTSEMAVILSLPSGEWDDNEKIKDVGQVTASYENDKLIKVTITNAYPSYEAWVKIGWHVLKHVSPDPVHGRLTAINIDVNGLPDDPHDELEIWWESVITDPTKDGYVYIGKQLTPCNEYFIWLHVHVLEDEIPPDPLQDTTYTFTVTIIVSQYNMPMP
jgi:hypothetical protein